ncbi:MAG: choice-of-anchor V domain-containing protein [Ferruginibacter sp.]
MKKLTVLFTLGIITTISMISFKPSSPLTLPNAPSGYSGAPTLNRTCRNCHNDFALNNAGGSVSVTGLPTGSYVAGQTYNFSVTISHASPAAIWSFALKAVVSGTSGTALGTFSTTNANVHIASSEIKTSNAVSSSGTSYTYTGLKWTAPTTGSSPVSFYFTGIAGDGDGAETGDYVYSGSILNIVMPVTLGEFNASLHNNDVVLTWNTYTELNVKQFEVERSINGFDFEKISSIPAAGNSDLTRNYQYTDVGTARNNGVTYYRLKVVDIDGGSQYSKVTSITNAVETYIEKIYPTILNSNSSVYLDMVSKESQQCQVDIYNVAGQKISQTVTGLKKGMNKIALNRFAGFAGGIYYFKIKAGDFRETRKILLQ